MAQTRSFELTPKQAEVRNILAGPEMHDLLYGGSRSGKTFLACYSVATRALLAPEGRHLIARLHNIDVRQSVMMDTWPKMMRLAYPGVPYILNKSDQFALIGPPGEQSEVWFGGLDDKDRVEKILGKEYATIYVNESSQVAYETILVLRTRLAQSVLRRDGRRLKLKFYCDLNPVGKGHWTYKEFVLGIRPDSGLPVREGTRAYAMMNPDDNPNLPQEYLDGLDELPERQRQRFKLGQYLSEVPGALWPLDRIESLRVAEAPPLGRIIIGVDPSGSDGVGGDRQGIVAVGLGREDGHAYVLEDGSVKLAPAGWAQRVVSLYKNHGADLIVAEANYGGAMVESTIRTADPGVPVKLVTASRGKHIRAEPVSALYEQGRVHHVGAFADLEDQMTMFTTAGYQGTDSPDRADALVWALTELMVSEMKGAAAFEFARQQAEAARRAKEPAEEKPPEYAPGSMEHMKALNGG